MNKVTRGERLMNKLVDEGTISSTGKDWLIAAVDPFHDHQLSNLQGWPDAETGASVVRCIKQSVTIQKPGGTLPAGNWDCHILQWPWLTGTQAGANVGLFIPNIARVGNNFTYASPALVFNKVGGLQVHAVAPGSNLDIMGSPLVSALVATLEVDPLFTQGPGRLLGIGFEVHNTTSTLNVQGSVLAYRLMANSPQPSTWVGTSTAATPNIATFSASNVRYPPKNAAEAMLLSGSRQWDAKEGIYSVGAFSSSDNPAYPIEASCPIINGIDQDDLDATLNTARVYFPQPANAITGTSAPVMPFRMHPIHQSGCIFSGLSDTTTLTINWNVYYETFPGPASSQILPLATPSCEFDPDALDLYSRIMIDLPVGVMVKENGLGDWFLDAASKAAKFIGPALAALPHPIAKGAGAALSYLGETGQNYVKRNPAAVSAPPNAWEDESGIREVEELLPVRKSIQPKKKKKKNGPLVQKKNPVQRRR